MCDEKRFGKLVQAALAELRNGTHDGLFTAQNHEENWHLAHRILVPAFGPLSIAGMFDDMKDVRALEENDSTYSLLTSHRLPASLFSSGHDMALTMSSL